METASRAEGQVPGRGGGGFGVSEEGRNAPPVLARSLARLHTKLDLGAREGQLGQCAFRLSVLISVPVPGRSKLPQVCVRRKALQPATETPPTAN
jgi:hypothetical protein